VCPDPEVRGRSEAVSAAPRDTAFVPPIPHRRSEARGALSWAGRLPDSHARMSDADSRNPAGQPVTARSRPLSGWGRQPVIEAVEARSENLEAITRARAPRRQGVVTGVTGREAAQNEYTGRGCVSGRR
jgi:hypothetical protein